MKDFHHTLTRYSRAVLRDLLAYEGYIVITVDSVRIQGDKEGRLKDIVFCESPSSNVYPGQRRSPITRVAYQEGSTGRRRRDPELLTAEGTEQLRHDMDAFHDEDSGTFRQVNFVDLLGGMLNSGRSLTARHCTGHWLEADSVQNLEYADGH